MTSKPHSRTAPSRQRADQGQQQDGKNQWQHRYDQYSKLAEQAGTLDAVTREGHWQHAEHFRRLMNGTATQ